MTHAEEISNKMDETLRFVTESINDNWTSEYMDKLKKVRMLLTEASNILI